MSTATDGTRAQPPEWFNATNLARLATDIITEHLDGARDGIPASRLRPMPPSPPPSRPPRSSSWGTLSRQDPAAPVAPPDRSTAPFAMRGVRDAPATGYYFVTEAGPPASPSTAVEPRTSLLPETHPEFYFAHGSLPTRPGRQPSPPWFEVDALRSDFPILEERVHGQRLVWLDNAATTQKPQIVVDRLAAFYAHENSNVHRGAHDLAARATDAYEASRSTVADFLGAGSSDEVVFVRGTTEAINLVAQSWGRRNVAPGDEILVPHLEHHANIVPWQLLAAEKGARLRVIPVDDTGQILLEEYHRLLTDRTRLVAIAHVSNALGTVLPVREMIAMAHEVGACVLVDGAQAVAHSAVNVQDLDSDFYAFSGHKVYGPTGVGVLHGKAALLESMPPWQGGGNMIREVTFERTTYQSPPTRFEAGTGNIADAVGLGAALAYLQRIGLNNVARYEHELLRYATDALDEVPGLHLVGRSPDKASILSFVLDGYRVEDVGAALNREGIALRAGHHCAQPIMRRFGLDGTVRPSLAMYNTRAEVDLLATALHRLAARRTHG